MPKLIRKVNVNNWDKPDWLPQNQSPSDSLRDLQSKGCALSFWKVEKDEQIDDVIIALAVNCKELEKVDILIVEQSIIESFDVKISNTPGETPYEDVNPLHVSLEELTTNKIDSISVSLLLYGQHVRKLRAEVISMTEAIKHKLNKSLLQESIQKKLKL